MGNILTGRSTVPATPSAGLSYVWIGTTDKMLHTLDDSGNHSLYGLTEGELVNGKLQVTVTSNNLTVAIKTWAGNDASPSDVVAVVIGGTVRLITAPLSVTMAAATNWMNLGGAELATKEADQFAYLSWINASSTMALLTSRIPYANLYSDFSGTSTNEKYAAFSSAPASTDQVVNIGRFAATLSAGAGYTWTVPTFTAANLIQRPIFETRVLTYQPTYTGYTGAVTTNLAQYQLKMSQLRCVNRFTGTSNATGLTFTLPFSPPLAGNGINYITRATDNGAANKAAMITNSATNVVTCYTDAGGSAWTASSAKGLEGCTSLWDI